jgi:hypothetical protein
MRENDDDAPGQGAPGDLADGLGETAEPGSSSTDPYGDEPDDPDGDTYDDDAYDDDSYDDSYEDDAYEDDAYGEEAPYGDTPDGSGDGSYGDGDTTDAGDVVAEDATDLPGDDDPLGDSDGGGLDVDEPTDFGPEDADPLEGIGFLLDELRDAVFGDEDDASVAPLDADVFDPADLASDTDLDLTGDGVVDRADLHEAASPFDFGVDHHGGHDAG